MTWETWLLSHNKGDKMQRTLGPVDTFRQLVEPVNWKVIGWILTSIFIAFIFYYLATLPRKNLISTQNKVIKYIVAGLCWSFILHVVVFDFILKEGALWTNIAIILGIGSLIAVMVRRMATSLLKYEPIINAFLIAGIGYGILDLFARGMTAYGWAGLSGCFGGVIGGGFWATMALYRREPTDPGHDPKTPTEARTKWQASDKL
jgi:hypothetical protein